MIYPHSETENDELDVLICIPYRNLLKSEDSGKLYVTKAGFSSGFNWLGCVKNIKEQASCQGLF